jgi:glycine/D-amino acid oxidase-like deaminating enzyme
LKVLVVGGGFAGVAAAFAARRAGASVTVVHAGAGASALYAGSVDGPVLPESGPHAALLRELAQGLGLRLSSTSVVATREGVVRPSRGADNAVLDLAPLAGKVVGLVDVARDDWDGPLLLRSFAESDWARSTGTRFELVPLELLEKSFLRRVSPFDFASSFERAERPAWLSEVLKHHAGPDAWLFGPWLGVKRELQRELTASVGVPVGEVTSPPGGVAGARFEGRRDLFLRSLGVDVVVERALGVRQAPGSIALSLDGRELTADVVVLAAGGFVSGAIRLSGALSGAEPAGFELALTGLPPIQARGEPVGPVSSLFGVDLAARGRQLLEHVGLATSGQGAVRGTLRVFAAGDLLGPEPPSVGHALLSGLEAGAASAHFSS